MSELIDRLSGLEKPEQFAGWLWNTLIELYPTEDKVNCESRLYQFVLREDLESTIEALHILYERYVPSYNQSSFRQGIGIALSKCTEVGDKRVFDVATDLIYLISQTKAVEALDGLLELNSNEFIAKNQNRILYDTVAIVQGLTPDDKVFDFTHSLVNSQYFDDGLIFSAIETMIDCKPDDSIKIVNKYGERIQKLYGAVHGIKDEESAYWEAVSKISAEYPKVKDMIHDFSKV